MIRQGSSKNVRLDEKFEQVVITMPLFPIIQPKRALISKLGG